LLAFFAATVMVAMITSGNFLWLIVYIYIYIYIFK